MKKIIKIVKIIAVLAMICAMLNIVSKQDIEYEHQRGQLAGYTR